MYFINSALGIELLLTRPSIYNYLGVDRDFSMLSKKIPFCLFRAVEVNSLLVQD